MQDRSDHIEYDTLAAYAVDALTPEEVVEVGPHLQRCDECRRQLSELRGAATLLPYGLPIAEPPADLRDRILERVRGERSVAGPVPVPQRPMQPSSRSVPWWRRLAPAFVAAALVLAFLLGRGLAPSESPDVARLPDARTVALTGQATGSFVVSPDGQLIRLSVTGLPPLLEDQVYQLWFLGAEGPISAGTFGVDSRGQGQIDLEGLDWSPNYTGVAITPEPRGGRSAPSGPIVAQGGFQAP